MDNQENEKLIREEKEPNLEAPEGKILAVGDMFRGPYTGIASEIDLRNPGSSLRRKTNRS